MLLHLLLLHLCLPLLCVGRCCVFPTTLPQFMTQNSATEPPMLVTFSITKTEKKSCGRQGPRNKKHCVVFLCFASAHLLTRTIDPSTTTSFSVFQTELFSHCEEGVTACFYPAGALWLRCGLYVVLVLSRNAESVLIGLTPSWILALAQRLQRALSREPAQMHHRFLQEEKPPHALTTFP